MTRQEEGGNNRVKKGKGQKWNKNRGPVGMDNEGIGYGSGGIGENNGEKGGTTVTG